MATFGTRFQKLRKQHLMTQNDIATKLNVSPQAISKWESDTSMPDISLLGDIADIFNVTIDELLGRQKEVVTKIVEKKDYTKMILKIQVLDGEDKIKINLPLQLIKLCIEAGSKLPNISGKSEVINSIDFKEIFNLVEQGVIGELITIEEKDGSVIKIFVE